MKIRRKTQRQIADSVEIDIQTMRKWGNSPTPPSMSKGFRTWKTRKNPFESVWPKVVEFLEKSPGLKPKSLFSYLQREYIGQYQDGQIRTLERKIKQWRALYGPPKEVFFPQEHDPGALCASDFTRMDECGVTIQGQPLSHLLYHFVLTHSNWETGTICYSESFESLSKGLQNALWELSAVPAKHRTDRLSAAVRNFSGDLEEFTERYEALVKHYGIEPNKTQAGHGNENGDVEKSHDLFKVALKQNLMLRGSSDFNSIEDYEKFLRQLFDQLNAGRQEKFQKELKVMKTLPPKRLEDYTEFHPKVSPNSTVTVNKNIYSVNSRLISEKLTIRQHPNHLEVILGSFLVDTLPRIRGKGHQINYRHIIEWLVRKPGAFENYRYKNDLYPTSYFRIAYDDLQEKMPSRANKEYLKILHLAAMESEKWVNTALKELIENGEKISLHNVVDRMTDPNAKNIIEINVDQVSLKQYDLALLSRVPA